MKKYIIPYSVNLTIPIEVYAEDLEYAIKQGQNTVKVIFQQKDYKINSIISDINNINIINYD